MKINPNFDLEIQSGRRVIAGLDEAGRGPLCGPVVAAAVVFPSFDIEIPVIIRDSKQMTPSMRAQAYEWITKNTTWAVGMCSPSEIDELNILWASMCAMSRAVDNLGCDIDWCLVDGNRVPQDLCGAPIVRGDARSLSIAAASIIAKQTRDNIMRELDALYPEYGWSQNAGYPTKSHLQAIDKYGINEHYRKTFNPIKQRIKDENSHD